MSTFWRENRAEEDRVLAQVSQSLRGAAALFVEPISVIGNDMATPYFY